MSQQPGEESFPPWLRRVELCLKVRWPGHRQLVQPATNDKLPRIYKLQKLDPKGRPRQYARFGSCRYLRAASSDGSGFTAVTVSAPAARKTGFCSTFAASLMQLQRDNRSIVAIIRVSSFPIGIAVHCIRKLLSCLFVLRAGDDFLSSEIQTNRLQAAEAQTQSMSRFQVPLLRCDNAST